MAAVEGEVPEPDQAVAPDVSVLSRAVGRSADRRDVSSAGPPSRPRARGRRATMSVVLVLVSQACTSDQPVPSPAPTFRDVGWTSLPPMPTPRSEVASATDGSRIVVAGGFTADGSTVATVEIFDVADETWSVGPDLPVAVNHAMAAPFDGSVAVLGGYAGPGLAGPTDRAIVLRRGRQVGELQPTRENLEQLVAWIVGAGDRTPN